jgi:lipopolysaccharide export system permease protein
MNILYRYIGRSVLSGILGTLLVLLILVSFVSLVDELRDVGKGEYDTGDAFLYMLLQMPRRIYELFPIAVLLGSLIGLGGLASHSELVAMRAAGVSVGAIVLGALRAGVLLLAAVLVIGELVAPESDQYAESMKAVAISQQVTLRSKYGFWARDGDAFVNIREILPGARLQDIYIYEFTPDRRLRLATHAAYAFYRGDRWELREIAQSEFLPDRVVSHSLESATWDSLLNPRLLSVVTVKPAMLSTWGLYSYGRFLRDNGQNAVPYEVALWSKLVMPAATLAMLLLAVPFVFGPLRSVGIGQRIFAGSLMGVVFFLVNRMFEHMAVVYGLPPAFAAAFPTLAVLALVGWLFRRQFASG